jgi:D-alanyl-D-alanine carboxypeptidase/D-alanyl-D-alanine-endopeptidase (penicillin-binding protein 4)
MKNFLKCVGIGIGCFFSSVLLSQDNLSARIEALMQQYAPTAYVGIEVLDAESGRPIYQYNANKYFFPASNTKLLTAAAALFSLGADDHYITTLAYDPKQVQGNTLKGNVYLKFSGDPSFTDADLLELLKALPQHGIRQVAGNVILDRSDFAYPNYPSTISHDDIHWGFAAPCSAIIINENYATLLVIAGKQLSQPCTVKPAAGAQYITFQDHIKTVTLDAAKNHCELLVDVNSLNHVMLGGCWPIHSSSELHIAVGSPEEWAAAIIRHQLKELNVEQKGSIKIGILPKSLAPIATHASLPLSKLITFMLKKSNNLYAESITKRLGLKYYHRGTLQEGANAIRKILAEQAGINLKETALYDGAGNSSNLVTPDQLAQLLYAIYHSPSVYAFLKEAFPHSCASMDRTLAYFPSFIKGLPPHVFAKTASMKGISTLSGYIETQNHHVLVFSILVNQVLHKLHHARALQAEICRVLAGL